jgi:hypothetical protein
MEDNTLFKFLKRVSLNGAALGVAGFAITAGAAQAQSPYSPVVPVSGLGWMSSGSCATPPCPTPAPPLAGSMTTPSTPSTPGQTPATPGQTPATPETPTPAPEDTSAGGGDTGLAAPFMIGDLLYATRSINYGFARITGNSAATGLGSTSIFNAAVAENNSPVPYDRVYFRYNFFHDSQEITGIANTPFGVNPALPLNSPSQVLLYNSQTKLYNTNLYTFGGEKTFFDGQASIEVRLPITTTLSPSNAISVGSFAGYTSPATFDSNINRVFNVSPTPGDTLGREDTYFDNMLIVLKGVFYRSEDRKTLLSGGLAIGIPTAPDTRLSVVDFNGTAAFNVASGEERRDITIANSTWAVSPFIAGLWLPSDRIFTQGFLQVECPLNSSAITYSDQFTIGHFGIGSPPIPALENVIKTGQSEVPPFTYHTRINEQYLLHGDVGTGYWLMRNQENTWLNGVALSFEAHYTGALSSLNRIQLPGNAASFQYPPGQAIQSAMGSVPQIPNIGPVVGAGPSRVDIVDLTMGTTFVFGNRATLAIAGTLPATQGSNRTFDWEAQVQLNFLFGAPR